MKYETKVLIGSAAAAAVAATFATLVSLAEHTRIRPEVVMKDKVCQELAKTAGYESVYTSDGTCWLKMEYGITVPYDVALDLLKFKYEAAETNKINRVEDVRQGIVYDLPKRR